VQSWRIACELRIHRLVGPRAERRGQLDSQQDISDAEEIVTAKRRLHDRLSASAHGSEGCLRILCVPEVNDARTRLAKALDVGAFVLGAPLPHRFEARIGHELHLELAGSAFSL
jgi:hypothetical protein